MSFPVEASFNQVLEDCITGKLLKEQALELLDNKYKSAYVDIKQKFGKDRQSFCCYVPCDFEEWIKICDGAERNKSFSEKKHNNNKIQKVIDEYTAVCGKNELESERCIVEVYKEVYEIQNLCRENQETKELYEKYKAEIKKIPDISDKLQVLETEQVRREDMKFMFQDMYDDMIITGQRIKGRWVVRNDKSGISELQNWAKRTKKPFFTSDYIHNNFCKHNGDPYSKRSVNNYMYNNQLTTRPKKIKK